MADLIPEPKWWSAFFDKGELPMPPLNMAEVVMEDGKWYLLLRWTDILLSKIELRREDAVRMLAALSPLAMGTAQNKSG